MKSTQPRKQRKMLYQAPAHLRYKQFSAPLSSSLKASYSVGSLPVRSGDTVRIMRGERKGTEGKVTQIDRKKYRILVEGVTRQKVDGSTTFISLHPSKVMITNLNLDDKWRRESLKAVATAAEAPKPVEAEEEKKPKEAEKPKRKRKPRKTAEKKTTKPKKPRKTKKTEEAEEEKTEES